MTLASTATPIVPQSPGTTIPSYLVAFPSFTHSLHSLTSATNADHIHLHVSSFSQHPQHSEAKVRTCILQYEQRLLTIPGHQLKAALDRNLAIAQQEQEEERQKRLIEMENAARLMLLEAQEGQVRLEGFFFFLNMTTLVHRDCDLLQDDSEPSSPLTIRTRVSLNPWHRCMCDCLPVSVQRTRTN